MPSEREPLLTWSIGDVRITRVVELPPAPLQGLLPDATPDAIAPYDWLAPFVDDSGRLLFSIHCLVVETPDRLVVVDTCIGNDKPRPMAFWDHLETDFLERFRAAGFEPERVDTVLCTHMHVDHVGWNTRLVEGRWIPTFPNARYLYAEKEWAHWKDAPPDQGPILEDSVQPIFDAGLADLVPSDHRISTELSLFPTEGHTPGHVSISIESRGERAVITGDMIHHPCQLPHPEWASIADTDANESTRTRRRFLERFADQPVLVIGTHFTAPTAGHVVRDGDRHRLEPTRDHEA
jgi:glyoxylase-like metal-dependent hydrolase (beta-lactamase superfamily II)